jgi:di/tricarboxylate transporter
VITILVGWRTVLWLYPAEKENLSEGKHYLSDSLDKMGAWNSSEKKALIWILLAMCFWATDFIHRTNPAVIGIGVGLLLALPKIGVLDVKAVKQVNFLIIAFSAGTLSMAGVLIQTGALSSIAQTLVGHLEPVLASPFYSAVALYWSGICYHILLANNQSMLSTSLPLLLQITESQNYNPISVGLLWAFAGGGNLFVYQSSVLVFGYSYGYFTAKDLLKIGCVLTIIEGVLLMFLVPIYWPMIGLTWLK